MDTLLASLAVFAAFALGTLLGRKFPAPSRNGEKAREEAAAARAQLAEVRAMLDREQKGTEALRQELRAAAEEKARLAGEREALRSRLTEQKADTERAQAVMAAEFRRLASEIFEEKTGRFAKESKEGLTAVLAPVQQKMDEFRKRMDEAFGTQAKEQFALKSEIERIVKANDRITLQAESLARALKGDVKAQGNWGEVMLERILEDSGLRKNEDYVVQAAEMGLKHAESGKAMRPDVVVRLPEGKHIVIDAKVSLTHYERFCSEEEEGAKEALLKQFLASIRRHAAELAQRRYQDCGGMEAPDFVLMFMPVEGAYALALQNDPSLHAYAWERRIVLVSPTMLFATLRTAASLWRIEKQNRHTLEIADAGGRLYDKIAGFVEDMQRLGGQLESVGKTYDGAMKKLSEGKGNVISQTERLRKLGAKASKRLPLVSEEAEAAEEEKSGEAAA
jgi:DNA recombination protein RmuC